MLLTIDNYDDVRLYWYDQLGQIRGAFLLYSMHWEDCDKYTFNHLSDLQEVIDLYPSRTVLHFEN